MLITDEPGNGDAVGEKVESPGVTENLVVGCNAWQEFAGDAEKIQHVLVPLRPAQVHEQGAGGVGHIGRVNVSAGKSIEKIGVHGAEAEFASPCALSGSGDFAQDPRDLGATEIRIEHQSSALSNGVLESLVDETGALFRGTAVLPDDRVVNRTAGL